MNNISNKCGLCGNKSKRLCPGLDKMICSSCCGSKRGTGIACSADCKYYPFNINGYDLWLRIDEALADKMVHYIVKNDEKDNFKSIIDRLVSDIGDGEEQIRAMLAGSAAYYVLFIKRDSNGKTLAEKWKTEGWPGLNNDERKMMECRINSSHVTIIEVQRILDHQAMECIDLFDEKQGKFILLDRSTASRAARFTRLFSWLTHYPRFSRPANNSIEIPDFIFHEFREILTDKFNKEKTPGTSGQSIKEYLSENFGSFCKLASEIARKKQTAILNKMDLHQCKAFYDVHENKFDEIKAVLDKYPDFDAREKHDDEIELPGVYYYSWLRRGESKKLEKKMLPSFRHEDESEGVGTLANVSLYPNQLIIETFTRQKYTFAKKMVDKYFAGMVTLKNEKVVDIAKQVAGRTGEEERENNVMPLTKPAELPLEIKQKVIGDFYKKHYKKMLDDRIPALDGMTPRQAARDPKSRPKLIELMKGHLKNIELQNRQDSLGLDITWVLDELNLPELK